MFLVCIILFYLLYAASAPAWCYVLNCMAIFVSLLRGASMVGTFIHETNPVIEAETQNTNGEAVKDCTY